MMDDLLTIDTPENVYFHYEVAGLGSRSMAAMLDSLLIGLLVGLVFAALLALLGGLIEIDGNTTVIALAVLLAFTFVWGYYIFFETLWNGQTPGKRWVGVRVIRANGLPVTLSAVIIRNLVRLADFLPSAYGVGIVTMFIHPHARRLGDLAAGTLVVFDQQSAVTLDGLRLQMPSRTLEPIPTEVLALPLERLTEADRALLDNYLQRRYGLANREALATQLLRHLGGRLGVEIKLPHQYGAAERLLYDIARAARPEQTP